MPKLRSDKWSAYFRPRNSETWDLSVNFQNNESDAIEWYENQRQSILKGEQDGDLLLLKNGKQMARFDASWAKSTK